MAAGLAAVHAQQHQTRLLTAGTVATMACLQVSEVARLQVCYLWFDHLMSYGVPGFEGTCSVHIDRRKNDTQCKGHYPAHSAGRATRSSTLSCSCCGGCARRGLR